MNKPFRQAVMAIVLKEDKTFLIGSSPRDGGYKFPQGGLDEGETKLEGLFRELNEELGTILTEDDFIEPLPISVKYPYPSHKPYSEIFSGQELHVFVVRYRDTMTFEPQDDEFDELHWIRIDDMEMFDFHHRKEAYYKSIVYALT